MIVVKIATFGFIALLISVGMLTPSYAHTTVEVEQYKIEAGWGIEPPVVGIRNDVVFKITESGENEGTYRGITSAFQNLEATVMYGGASKNIDINSDEFIHNKNVMLKKIHFLDELLDKAGSKYSLVLYAAKRARQINAYYSQLGEGLLEYVGPLVDTHVHEKPLSIALREINEGLLTIENLEPTA